MAVKARKVKRVVDEMAKFEKGEIEFLFEMIKEAMIPGKFLPTAMSVVTKLKNQYKLLDKRDLIIKKEESRQISGIELIASENFTSPAVMEATGSILTNK